MPDSPYISDPSWTCTITAGSATVPVAGVVAHLVIQPGDHLIGAGGGLMAIGAVTASTITLLRNAPAAQAGAGIPLIVERGPWRAMPAAAAIVSREVYERMQIAVSDGRSLPVISILNTPPASPAHGDRYLIGTAPTGAWAGRANSIAEWSDVVGGWVYAAPVDGWSVTINGSRLRYQYGGGAWGTAQMSAADVTVTPTGNITATNAQAALAELDTKKVGKTGAQTMAGPLGLVTAADGRQLYVREWLDLTSGGDGFSVVANNLYHEYVSNKYRTTNTHASLGYSAVRLGFGGAQFAGSSAATTAGAEVTPTWRQIWDSQLFRRPDTGPWQVATSPSDGAGVTMPAGGTWAYFLAYKTISSEGFNSTLAGIAAGGATVGGVSGYRLWGFVWRIV